MPLSLGCAIAMLHAHLAAVQRLLATVQQREAEADEHLAWVAAFEVSSGGVWRRVAPPDGWAHPGVR
jgi:hypothetical protein